MLANGSRLQLIARLSGENLLSHNSPLACHLVTSSAWHHCECILQDIVKENISLNSPTIRAAGGSAAAAPLVWGVTRAAELEGGWHAPDLVVAADVVYRRDLFQPLLHALADLSGEHPAHTGTQPIQWFIA